MLIVWRGYGWLVPVVAIIVMILSQVAIDALYGDGFYTAKSSLSWEDGRELSEAEVEKFFQRMKLWSVSSGLTFELANDT
jgi:hypothetical protein